MAWNCSVGFVGMFGTYAIANFDLSKWLLNSLFNIGNPFAIYFWLVAIVIILRFTFIIIPLVKLISLFSGKRGAKAFSAFFKLRKINSSAFKPLENYLLFESFRMLTPGLCAILLRLILGDSLIYKWDFIQLWIILPSIVVWLLYNLIGIKESNDTINTAAKTLAPKINVPFTGNSKEKTFNTAPIISTLFSKIVTFRKQTEEIKNIKPGEKSIPYEMNLEKMRVSSNSGDGIETKGKSIDNKAIFHNTKELAKKTQNIAGNLLVDGKKAAIAAASKTATSFDEKLSHQIETIFDINSQMKQMAVKDMLNSIGPLIIIYAILPLTIM